MLKKTLCSLLIGSSVLLGSGCATPKRMGYDRYKLLQSMYVTPSVDAIILVAEPRDFHEQLRKPFECVYEWAVASALKDNGVKKYTVTFNATRKDLLNAIENPEIQTIVVAGHGQWGWWCASDSTVYESQVEQFMAHNNIPKKKGLFIRHTCGQDRIRSNGTEKVPFGKSVVDDASKTRGYDFIAGPIDYIFNPIPDYKVPKIQAEYCAKNE